MDYYRCICFHRIVGAKTRTSHKKIQNCNSNNIRPHDLLLNGFNLFIGTSRPNFTKRSCGRSLRLFRMDRTNRIKPLGYRNRHSPPNRKRHKSRQNRRRQRTQKISHLWGSNPGPRHFWILQNSKHEGSLNLLYQ